MSELKYKVGDVITVPVQLEVIDLDEGDGLPYEIVIVEDFGIGLHPYDNWCCKETLEQDFSPEGRKKAQIDRLLAEKAKIDEEIAKLSNLT